MQLDFDVDVLMGTIQRAAMRRGLYVAYTPPPILIEYPDAPGVDIYD